MIIVNTENKQKLCVLVFLCSIINKKMHKKEKNSVVIAKKVVSSQRYSYITHIMEPEAKRLAVLEDALDNRLDICSSEGPLKVFP